MSRKLILASTMTMILAGTDASALGLGGIRTLSVLNQPFSGEIEIHDVKPDELDTIKVSIASQEAFTKAGIERYYYLTKLTFSPEVSPQGKSVIRVSSRDPIREPYMDLLVKVQWPNGQLVKEYTVLLDPPVLANRRAPRVDTPKAIGAQAGAAQAASGVNRVASSPSNPPAAPGEGFPVSLGPIEAGDGLWKLARNHTPGWRHHGTDGHGPSSEQSGRLHPGQHQSSDHGENAGHPYPRRIVRARCLRRGA